MLAMTVTQAQIDVWAINMKVYFNDVEAVTGSLLNTGDVIKIVAKEGFKFDSVTNKPMVYLYRKSGSLSSSSFAQYGENDTEAYHTVRGADFNFSGIYRDINAGTLLELAPEPEPTNFLFTFDQTTINSVTANKAKAYINNVLVKNGDGVLNGQAIELIPDDGYELDLDNTYITGYDDYNYDYNFKFNSNGKLILSDVNSYFTLQVRTKVATPTTLFTITQAVLNNVDANKANMYVNGFYAVANQKLVSGDLVRLDAKTDYKFEPDQVYFTDDYSYPIYFTGTESRVTHTMSDSNVYESLTVNTVSAIDPDMVRLTVTQDILDIFEVGGAKLYINSTLAVIGSEAYNQDTLKVVANTGREFISRPMATAYNSNNYVSEDYFVLNGNAEAELYIDLYADYVYKDFEVITTQVDIVSGSNNLYKITSSDLSQINRDRFTTDGGNPPSVVDYGDNILGVINLPFDIDPVYIQEPETIVLGTLTTTVTAPKISTDKLFRNLGDIEVPLPDNSLGFTNARAILHLPYANSLDLDINEVLGYIINVEYVIDLYNGTSFINVKSNKENSIIASSSVDLGITIPYSANQGNNPTVYNANMSLGGDNHVKSPYIEIIQNVPILGNGFFTTPVIDESELFGNVGFIRVDEIDLNVSATSREKELIISALKTGVIIK